MNPWHDLNKIEPDVKNPSVAISELFEGISSFTDKKVNYKLHKVSFFPEEVTYSSPVSTVSSFSESFSAKKNPHPEYGYNPMDSKIKQYFRYRILLFPTNSAEIEYELFKIRYPILLYPVTFFLDRTDFDGLESYFNDNNELIAESQTELIDVVTKIIKSESTIWLIKRLMAI